MAVKPFFFWDTLEGVFEYFDTPEARDAALKVRLKDYVQDSCWIEEVDWIVLGEITATVDVIHETVPTGEIDNEGLDEAGVYWCSEAEEAGCMIDYGIKPLEKKPC